MDHDKIRLALAAFRDGESNETERLAVRGHLEGCPGCRLELSRLENLARLFFKPAPRPSARRSEAFASAVMARLEAAEPAAGSGRPLWRQGPWLVSVLGLGLAALFFFALAPAPESLAPTDALFLLDARDRSVGEYVLPPDPGRPADLLAYASGDR